MSCSTGNTIYYNIRELPEIFAIENGNLILVETETGTNILDYENFIIDLDHTTFGETITQNTANIDTLSAKSASWDSTYTTVATYSAQWSTDAVGATQEYVQSYAVVNSNIVSLSSRQELPTAGTWADVTGLTLTKTFSGTVNILASLDVTSYPNWGDKGFRLVVNDEVKVVRGYQYVSSAYERDWTFDLPFQMEINGEATIKVQYKSAKPLYNQDSTALVDDVRPWVLMTW